MIMAPTKAAGAYTMIIAPTKAAGSSDNIPEHFDYTYFYQNNLHKLYFRNPFLEELQPHPGILLKFYPSFVFPSQWSQCVSQFNIDIIDIIYTYPREVHRLIVNFTNKKAH